MTIHSTGVATIEAPTKAHAKRRARQGDFDAYELQAPEVQITSLGEGKPVVTSSLARVGRRVVFRSSS
jgi:hypothetical protein